VRRHGMRAMVARDRCGDGNGDDGGDGGGGALPFSLSLYLSLSVVLSLFSRVPGWWCSSAWDGRSVV
jgi:hypothetical protein